MKSLRPYTPPALRLLSSNIARAGNPLGLKKSECAAWASDLRLPRQGTTILYTGCEYQMTSYLRPLVEVLKRVKFKDSLFSTFSAGGKLGIGLMKAYTKVTSQESERYNRILRMAALNLRKLGIDFAYLEEELYSGAMLYEYGLFDDFEQQAKRVAKQFEQAGVKRIIALSPHSAEVFQQIYPKFLSTFDLEVVPYVCLIAQALSKRGLKLALPKPLRLTIHDPCHLARSLRVTEEPRKVLQGIANLELRETALNRELTNCCGAPSDTVFPELSQIAATRRAEELAATDAQAVVTLCPFCHSHLRRGVELAEKKLEIIDFIEVLHQALEVGRA
jgi:Fe-S oxidoreductase